MKGERMYSFIHQLFTEPGMMVGVWTDKMGLDPVSWNLINCGEDKALNNYKIYI